MYSSIILWSHVLKTWLWLEVFGVYLCLSFWLISSARYDIWTLLRLDGSFYFGAWPKATQIGCRMLFNTGSLWLLVSGIKYRIRKWNERVFFSPVGWLCNNSYIFRYLLQNIFTSRWIRPCLAWQRKMALFGAFMAFLLQVKYFKIALFDYRPTCKSPTRLLFWSQLSER